MSRRFNKIKIKRSGTEVLPTHVYVNDKMIHGVKAVSFEQDLKTEIPTCTLTLNCLDGFECIADAIRVNFTPQTIEEAKEVLRRAGIKEV